MHRSPQFSRWMPPLPPPTTGAGERVRIAGCALLLVLAVVIWPTLCAGLIAVGLTVIFFAIGYLILMTMLAKMLGCQPGEELRHGAEARKSEDIGTFARAFDRRSEPFDPWVVRATWDALQDFISVPIRPTDRFVEDYGMALDDLEVDHLLIEIATRSGHSLKGLEANPYSARFWMRDTTVGDLVKLISWQPRIENKE